MNNNKCIYLKQKINRTLECKKQKVNGKNKIINIIECNGCKYRELSIIDKNTTFSYTKNSVFSKKCKNQIKKKNSPSKRTKALAITKQVKLIVWERDNHKCIFCGCEVPWNLANSHFIKRSHGGLGIPENLFCNCLECHNKFDDSINRKWMLPIVRNYLMSKYVDWEEDNLVYKKRL